MAGKVVVAATPLGNVADASPRLIEALKTADIIAAEDTRRTRHLAHALDVTITGRVVSNFDHNEAQRVDSLLADVADGAVVLVVSDAGMPLVSDPGMNLVQAAHDRGLPVTCLPGPSAVTTALAASGLAVTRFCFDGFAPRKLSARTHWLQSLKAESRACCFFESPHRLASTFQAAVDVLGPDRRACVCRELTKVYEEVKRGTLAELSQWAETGVRGEITVVIEGASDDSPTADMPDIVAQAQQRVEAGERLKSVCKELAAQYNVRTRDLYNACLESAAPDAPDAPER